MVGGLVIAAGSVLTVARRLDSAVTAARFVLLRRFVDWRYSTTLLAADLPMTVNRDDSRYRLFNPSIVVCLAVSA